MGDGTTAMTSTATRFAPLRASLAAAAALVASLALGGAGTAYAHGVPDDLRYVPPPPAGSAAAQLGRTADPLAVEDRFGPGAVLNVGRVFMKIMNNGVYANPFTNTSSDPSGQWPGSSGIEYLNFIGLAVGAVNPNATDPNAIRRVSYAREWRPPSLDPEDKIYRGYDGVINGTRFFNDDGDHDPITGDQKIDEDFLDGRDNDGDGLIDEDHGALGQQMFSLVIRDDTREAINSVFNEKHVPLGLEARVKAWAYSIEGFQDFNVIEHEIFNRSGHTLDSVYVGFIVDMDAGPSQEPGYWTDDHDLPTYPSGVYPIVVGSNSGNLPDPMRAQFPHSDELNTVVSEDSALCPVDTLRINGFSTCDDNGDNGKTPGMGSFMLIHHTLDPLGLVAPKRVQFRAFRSFTASTPYQQGGNPVTDQQKYEFMSGHDNVDDDGNVTLASGDSKGDYVQWFSCGPFLNFANGQSINITVAFGVKEGTFQLGTKWATDLLRYHAGSMSTADLLSTYPSFLNAVTAQIAYEGIHEPREGFPVPDFHGRETGIRLPRGTPTTLVVEDCSEMPGRVRREIFVTDRDYSWFDFDCNYCTGVYDAATRRGLFHKTWNASAPPPNPNTNVASTYNFTDNPGRNVNPTGDRLVTLAWDNASETTADPKSRWFDFRGYNVWKVSDWSRPVGSPGPAESDWKLLAQFRRFDYYTRNDESGIALERNYVRTAAGADSCPIVFVPNYVDPATGEIYYDPVKKRYGKDVPICLDRWDLWNQQSGQVLKPDWSITCAIDTAGARMPFQINSGDVEFQGGSYQQSFPAAGSYAYLCLRHPLQKGQVVVEAGGADSAQVDIVDDSVTGFQPATVTIRPGGSVRWRNTSLQNHTVSSDRKCESEPGCIVHRPKDRCNNPANQEVRMKFPVGRYSIKDPEVKNGFIYFYSVTAFDSTSDNSVTTELSGRRSAVEAEGVVPQITVGANGDNGVWVVPNPYRGFALLQKRPSAWDLTPNAADPTGTHIDFMGLPANKWTIRIYTISGDLVQEIHSSDAVNESIRPAVQVGKTTYPGYNRQQDYANDGQARWNLISRNGQDVVSGIYMFTVESDRGTQRGRFVIIR
jgi:plastocyanin